MTTTISQPSTPVRFDSAVLQSIRRHARTSMDAEICGVLLGDAENGCTNVVACIAGERAAQGAAHVTFTQETWGHIFEIKDRDHLDKMIVGWYHSHPGFGVFLSDHDTFIHENFFSAEHQVAWVFDPHSDEEGCFGWLSGAVRRIRRFEVETVEAITAPRQELEYSGSSEAPTDETVPEITAVRPSRTWHKIYFRHRRSILLVSVVTLLILVCIELIFGQCRPESFQRYSPGNVIEFIHSLMRPSPRPDTGANAEKPEFEFEFSAAPIIVPKHETEHHQKKQNKKQHSEYDHQDTPILEKDGRTSSG
jgi:proteasome lid subunit RPN8/RPN11